MTIQELGDIISRYTELGFMEAVKRYEPAQDLIRASDVKPWLEINRIDYKKFKAFLKRGDIKPIRKGTAANSPLFYSKAEISKCFAVLQLHKHFSPMPVKK